MMKTKKLLGVLLALLMLLPVIPLYVSAEIYSGYCGENGDNVKWELDTITKTLTISGEGNMANFATNAYGLRAPWYPHRMHIENVVVTDGIEMISGYSFYDCNNLKTISISKDVWGLGVYSFYRCTNLKEIGLPKSLSIIGDYAFRDCYNIKDVYYDGSIREWKNVKIYRSNDAITNAQIHYSDVYNIGEETYNFKNFEDSKSKGYCFGMSSTSSGYHIGTLDISIVMGNYTDKLYSLTESETLKKPIRFYQDRQGITANRSIVAGGTHYKTYIFSDIEKDWNEVVDYVKNHKYDDAGTLQIGYRIKVGSKVLGHSVNFLRYSKVDNQERIYIYDNNCPHTEKYIYKSEDGKILYKNILCENMCPAYAEPLICIAIRDMEKYFSIASEFKSKTVIYAKTDTISIDESLPYLMDGNEDGIPNNMYEFDETTTTVKITPLVDNASFTYLDKEYSFGKIDEDTYAEFSLSTSEDEAPEFEIVNAPEEDPSESCSCNCHASGIKKIFFIIINFFEKLFGKNKVCACGVSH